MVRPAPTEENDVVFKRMLGALGVGGPRVDTVLSSPHTYPGGVLSGQVNLTGGGPDLEIEHIILSLVAGMEVEGGGAAATGEFHRTTVSGPLRLAGGQDVAVPFELELPWETPITAMYGRPLRGLVMGVHTEVSIARAVDKGDLDPILVNPLPVQLRILDAFTGLGFGFKGADLEYGLIAGAPRTLPFYQVIAYSAAPRYAPAVEGIELTFVTGPDNVEVILASGGRLCAGGDEFGRYTVDHAGADTVDWTRQVDGWIRRVAAHRHGGAEPDQGRPHGNPVA